MKIYWTSNKSINGLRHFVLVNTIKEEEQTNYLMVSVIDVKVSLEISKKELLNSENWREGWLDLPKSESITKDYLNYKLRNNIGDGMNKIFVNNDSFFNIS